MSLGPASSSLRSASEIAFTTLVALLALGSCVPADDPSLAPSPRTIDPEFRLGIVVDAARATIGGGGAFRVIDPDEGELGVVDSATTIDAAPRGGGVAVGGSLPDIERRVLLIIPSDSAATVRINGQDYRGSAELRRGDRGLTVVNVVGLEHYLAGVVGAEMGRRAPGEEEALKAQAVASRTYALRNRGRWNAKGFDLVADVNDQAYAGTRNENPMSIAAVAATRGEAITVNGEPIEAFYSSTCGGRTEEGSAAFAGARRPYLQSISDTDTTGAAWCAISPRFRWAEHWTPSQMATILRRTLPANRLSASRAGDLIDLRVIDRTDTDRAATIELGGRNGRTLVLGQAIRRVLAMPAGGILRSNDFEITIDRRGGRIQRVSIVGRGNGHAVGMCQWGAVGRARAGHDYATILASYFPGTELRQIY